MRADNFLDHSFARGTALLFSNHSTYTGQQALQAALHELARLIQRIGALEELADDLRLYARDEPDCSADSSCRDEV